MAILTVLSAATGCGGAGTESPPAEDRARTEPQRGGTVVIAVTRDFDAFNELVSVEAATRAVMGSMLFLPLVQFDSAGRLRPALAESWELARDGKSVTYRLRRDVAWHDGVPTTADDVQFTYERAVDPDAAYVGASRFLYVTGADVIDPYTIRFRFERSFAEPIEQMAAVAIMPRHLLESVPAVEMSRQEFNRRPVGNGPFRFVSWKPDHELVLEANPAFSPSLGGPPFLERVVFRVVPEQSTALTMLLTGEIDVLESVPPADAARVEGSPAARLLSYPGRSYVLIAWNQRLAFFDTAAERRAMTLAMDRRAMVDALLHGFGSVAATHADETAWVRDPAIEPLPYDPDLARALLAEAGWLDRDGDGVLDASGRRFEFDLVTAAGSSLGADLSVMVQDQLARIGVVARPVLREWATLMEDVQRKDFAAFMTALAFETTYNPRDLFHTDAIEGENNWISFSNATVDSLIDVGLAVPERERAKPVWIALQHLLAAEQPYTWLFLRKERVGVSRRIRGLEPGSAGDPRAFSHWPTFGIRYWWVES